MSTSYAPSDIVLVTGANGHVAQHVVDQLLHIPIGPRVRATVRSLSTAQAIGAFYAKKADVASKIEVVVIPNIIKDGAFDNAVKGTSQLIFILLAELLMAAISGVTHIAYVLSLKSIFRL